MSSLFKSTVIKGTRITDFSQTTATVGVTIPFGYGRFVSGGNCIWAPLPPKEHVAKKRQGKGGVKQEVYTYTLSYAIAFAKGPISGYWWIKRNGKVVWTQDPDAPLDDVAYAAKWAEKATFYMGTMDQLPDSTIESYEGTGQVSAYRRLAYIVLEDDDVTEGGGAVPTYEACVIRGAAKSYTTPPYPVYVADSIGSGSGSLSGKTFEGFIDSFESQSQSLDSTLREVLQDYTYVEAISVVSVALNGTRVTPLVSFSIAPESLDTTSVALNSVRKTVLIKYSNYEPEELDITSVSLGGTKV